MAEIGYSPKKLQFDKEAQDRLVAGVSKIGQAVGSTLGWAGQTVLIESPQHTHGITVTKDGVTVAKAIDLLDPTENLAVRMMREAAERTAINAGDGTTTSIVLAEAFVKAGIKHIGSGSKTPVFRELIEKTTEVVNSLKKKSKTVTKGKLKDVATISANNDKELGKIISDVYKAVGKNGVVTVGKSQTHETYHETTRGIKIDRGYNSEQFINDHKRDECVFEDTHILVCDSEISSVLQIEKVLQPIIAERKRLLIIAPCSKNVINTFAANVIKNDVKICVIQPPSFGYKQHELMQDIALSVGAKYYSEKTGDNLSLIEFSDLGHASKISVGRDSSIIIKDDKGGITDDAINERVAQLIDARSAAKEKRDREFISQRIASLTGGVGVIYAGGNTDLEQKELFDRIDDAVCAVRSALEEGIVAGGGVALYRESFNFEDDESESGKIMLEALRAPAQRIWDNAEASAVLLTKTEDYDLGYDVKNREYVRMFEAGIIDPTKVTRSALQNAVSVAISILSTNAVITMARTYEN
jgi:chaperonin GroEL